MSGNVQQGLGRNAPRVQAIATQKLFFRQNNFGTQTCGTYSCNKSRWPAANNQKMPNTYSPLAAMLQGFDPECVY